MTAAGADKAVNPPGFAAHNQHQRSPVAWRPARILNLDEWLYQGTRLGSIAREQESDDLPQPQGSGLRYLRHGFLSNSLNPKVALFFVTFLPQFLPVDGGALGHALLLSGAFALLYLVWFSLYVLTVDRFGVVLRRPQVRARIEQVTGTILIGFGVRLALQQP